MKLFISFLGLILGSDPCLSGESQPNYGGSCWNKWGSIQDIELWAAENCGGNNCPEGAELTESCFTNPFPYKPNDLKPITLDNYEEFAAKQDKPNFSNDPNCEDVLQPYNEWFKSSSVNNCKFNIDMTNKYGEVQSTQFYSNNTEAVGCNQNGNGRDDLNGCYCDLSPSNIWLEISSDLSATHPQNPKTVRRSAELFDLSSDIAEVSSLNDNIYRELKHAKNHANMNNWRMDCLYCAMMDVNERLIAKTFYFEYVLETYEAYVDYLMHLTCAVHYNEEIMIYLRDEFEEIKEEIANGEDFCNGPGESCFEGEDCSFGTCVF
ncbi:unnamed protein product [Oikopleura dioica]|uniref:Uncharacterized protein n=1 Tax=Oikopleura dioica TaxID=34765 RepID=E4YZD5_OIKDI|nr:unnamed protein product [Oikopleura dioica]